MNRRILILTVAVLALLTGLPDPAPAVGNTTFCGGTQHCRVYITNSFGNFLTDHEVRLEMGTTGANIYATTDSNGLATFEIPGNVIYCCEDTATLHLENPPAGHEGWDIELVFRRVNFECFGFGDDPVKEWDFGGVAGKNADPNDCLDYDGYEDLSLKVAYPSLLGSCPF